MNSNLLLLFQRYIPNATGAIYEILKKTAHLRLSKKQRYENDDAELLKKISGSVITEETLREKLAQHVEQVTLLMHLVLGFKLTLYHDVRSSLLSMV